MRVLEASDLQPVRHNCTECFILTVQNVTDRTEFARIKKKSGKEMLEYEATTYIHTYSGVYISFAYDELQQAALLTFTI